MFPKHNLMYVVDKNTAERFEAEIARVEEKEFNMLKKNKNFDFDWSIYRGEEVYKLYIKNSTEILGLMRIIDHPGSGFDFLEIDVIEISKKNQGMDNGLGRIGGCLLGYAAMLSHHYGHDGVIFLVAKNKKAALFHEKFGFEYIGNIGVLGERMVSETRNSIELIREYLYKI